MTPLPMAKPARLDPLDVPCTCCGAIVGVGCRAWSRVLAPMDRVHRVRGERRKSIERMHIAALALFGDWPTDAEIEMLARFGEGAERERAAKLLSQIEATGYEGELFCIT